MTVKPYIILNTSRKHVNYEEVPMNKPYNIQNKNICNGIFDISFFKALQILDRISFQYAPNANETNEKRTNASHERNEKRTIHETNERYTKRMHETRSERTNARYTKRTNDTRNERTIRTHDTLTNEIVYINVFNNYIYD
jgi:catalase